MASPSKLGNVLANETDKGVIDGIPSGNNVSTDNDEKLKVVVRVRPLQAKEEPWPEVAEADIRGPDLSAPATIIIQENEVMWEKNGHLKVLKADAVFTDGATQDSVFRSVAECIDALIAGFDCSVFAYGQTGTGKTYTMSGLQREEDANINVLEPISASHGVVPRSIETLFAKMEKEKQGPDGASFSIYCSFIEIYNEKIYDILSPDMSANTKNNQPSDAKAAPAGSQTQRARWNSTVSAKELKSLPIRQKLDGSVFVDGMTSRNVSSKAELLQAFREGSLNREVRDNLYNQFSSRGHSVFQITLRRTFAGGENKATSKQTRLSRLFFVDLAGSEKWHVNGSELTDKYASELASINKSLSALTNCVLALTQKERSHVPFRDSVLTRLLQTCLQGSGRTAFIVTISPSKGSLEESFATLRFAERLKAMRIRPIRRSLFSSEMLGEQRLYYERQIQTMRAEVNRLRELLRRANQRPNVATEDSSRNANAALVEENRRLKELLLQSERSRRVDRVERNSGKKAGNAPMARMSPQQFSARQILNPASMRSEEANTSASARSLLPNSQANNTGNESASKSDQLTSLETQLQSKEARLNWMLEAEMEAQNTGAGVANPSLVVADTDPSHRPTVTRSWAVETRLRRQLLSVPPPLREDSANEANGHRLSNTLSSSGSKTGRPTAGPRPGTRERVLPVLSEKASSSLPKTNPIAPQSPPRHPDRRRAPSPPTESRSRIDDAVSGGRRGRLDTIDKFYQVRRSDSTASTSHAEQGRAASILKLVGSGSNDTTGKTREELVEEYKRARRVELEAMMRTMVQK